MLRANAPLPSLKRISSRARYFRGDLPQRAGPSVSFSGENAEDAGHGHPMALYDRPKNTKLEGMAGVPLALAFYTDENPVGFVMVETRYPSAEGPSGCEPSCHFK